MISSQQSIVQESLTIHEMSGDDSIFIIEGGSAPWGDYGRILAHGMTSHLGRKGGEDGPLQLERTGPFVPPITFPGIDDIVVTDEAKRAMEAAGFRGVSFRPVILARIVEVPWHIWDLEAKEPAYYPKRVGPEGYILDKRHSPKLANQLGTLWEVVRENGAEIERLAAQSHRDVRFRYVKGSWNGNDLFSVSVNRYKYASARAKRWFEKHLSQWTSFRDGMNH